MNQEQENSALSVFPGGKPGVLERMTSMVKTALSKENDAPFREWFAKEFNLTEDEMELLQAGKEPVDFSFFEKAKEALGVSIHDVLGQASFNNGEKEHWINQQKSNPMVLTAPIKQPRGGKENQADSGNKDIELLFYVRLRAINELLHS